MTKTLTTLLLASLATTALAEPGVITFKGKPGLPGSGKKVVLLGGDEEYRSEEANPQLAKILSQHHGFDCVVTFSVDPETGHVDVNNQTSTPGLQHLDDADLCIMFWRFRNPDAKASKHLDAYVKAGKPIIGLRTSTHGIRVGGDHPFSEWSFNSNKEGWKGGFGQQILGDTWINHHGHHKREATRGVIRDENKNHPILRGVDDMFGPTDVYGIRNLPDSATVLVDGQVIAGMKPEDPPVEGKKNDPMQPVIWLKDYQVPGGKKGVASCNTFFSSMEMLSEDIRRVTVNTVYFLTGLEGKITGDLDVSFVGKYEPTMYGFTKGEFWKEKALDPKSLK